MDPNDDSKQKILIAGDVKGKLSTLFKRVTAIQKKYGAFDLLLCVGDFFGDSCMEWDGYTNGEIVVPIETYILGPASIQQIVYYNEMGGGDLAPNISFLGSLGIFTTAKGSRIAYLSGAENGTFKDSLLSAEKITKLSEICKREHHHYHGVDILITNQWPSGITEMDKNAFYTPKNSSEMLCWLIKKVMPRYHFAGTENIFYERPPFTHVESNRPVASTRFISLANVGNLEKKRWLYALSIIPIKQQTDVDILIQGQGETPLPFTNLDNLRNIFEQNTQYFFEAPSVSNKRKFNSGAHNSKHTKHPNIMKNPGCWFCLSDPDVEKHLILSIGKHSYLALAKGGLNEEHLIISSIGHYSSMHQLSEIARKEIIQYKEVLKTYFDKQNKIIIVYERNFKTFHLQIQIVPLPKQWSESLKDIYIEAGREQNIKFEEHKKNTKAYLTLPADIHYFHIEFPDGIELIHRIYEKFPMHFGREVLVQKNVLNMKDKGDWHNCFKSKKMEIAMAEKFRKKFRPFDFSLDDV